MCESARLCMYVFVYVCENSYFQMKSSITTIYCLLVFVQEQFLPKHLLIDERKTCLEFKSM